MTLPLQTTDMAPRAQRPPSRPRPERVASASVSEEDLSAGSRRQVFPLDSEARATLVESHVDLVQRLAHRIHERCSKYIDIDELVALGNVGLTEAATRFDPNMGIPFRSFAYYRVQGAIIDGVRRSVPLPRRAWQRIVALRAAADYLEHLATTTSCSSAPVSSPAPAELADTLAELRATLASIRTVYLTSLNTLPQGQEPVLADDVADRLDRERLARRARDAVAALPLREQLLVRRCYWDGEDLVTVAEELGISKSWASRLHARAIDRMRDWYEQRSDVR